MRWTHPDPARAVDSRLALKDGSRVAVLGGGPAGSFFSIFLLDVSRHLDLDLDVDIYEPRDFVRSGPSGCNMCGGIISESLVQTLAVEGINLPETVVQRGIDSYVLHMDVGSVRIETPLQEKRIAAVFRSTGPRELKEATGGGFDGHLQELALDRGANVLRECVDAVFLQDGKPTLQTRRGSTRTYDLLAVSSGVNSKVLQMFEHLDIGYRPPRTTRALIREFYLGAEAIAQTLGNAMHVFLLDIPRLEFAALIPKGDYVTLSLLGEDIDKKFLQAVLEAPEVRRCFPPGFPLDTHVCQCSPKINIVGASQPFADRIVFIGDAGVTRLYKDGIGAAYRTAKAAVSTVLLHGISSEALRRHYLPACRAISRDNRVGRFVFKIPRQIQRRRYARRAVLRMVSREQQAASAPRHMSMVLWDLFTGGAPYREIFMRTLRPRFWSRFLYDLAVSGLRTARVSGRRDGNALKHGRLSIRSRRRAKL